MAGENKSLLLKPMFTTGQLVFAGLFFLGFASLIYFSYSKDKALHTKNYPGSWKVLIGFIIFVIFLFSVKFILKN